MRKVNDQGHDMSPVNLPGTWAQAKEVHEHTYLLTGTLKDAGGCSPLDDPGLHSLAGLFMQGDGEFIIKTYYYQQPYRCSPP